MDVLKAIQENIVFFDGGTGTVLQQQGLRPGEAPEEWSLTRPEKLLALHRAYLSAGSQLIKTNTFGANRLRFQERTEAIVRAGVKNARAAITDPDRQAVALDIGPCGRLLKPLGDLAFEDAVELFAEVVRWGSEGADLILIETMNDACETKAAVLAAKENCSLPIFVTNVYDSTHKLMTGADPRAMIALLEGLGVAALGMNCSAGPEQLAELLPEFLRYASVPVILNPNAGLPRVENGKTVYDVTPQDFAACMKKAAALGVRILGGCCGTTPDYLQAVTAAVRGVQKVDITPKTDTLISSYTHAVSLSEKPVLIGERINPTGKKRLQQALREGDMSYVLRLATEQADCGADLLDVNTGLPGVDEKALLTQAVQELQSITDLPLQLDSSDPEALEAALRVYNGKPLINSVNAKKESMAAIFPLAKHYGGAVIALTLDENGIPDSAEGRLALAEKLLKTAQSYGLSKKDIIFDALTLPVSAEPQAALVTLETLRLIKERLGCRTCLGLSNVSFGLPDREAVNTAFFAMALQNGLDCAIFNPLSEAMRRTYYASMVLLGRDESCRSYLAHAQPVQPPQAAEQTPELFSSIERGLTKQAALSAREALKTLPPMTVINEKIIPALDAVGRGFEAKTLFLPQLLMSAEAASAAFEEVRQVLAQQGGSESKGTLALATVQGDIHDIGKNIVRVLLENYGFRVRDLGKDVAPERILQAVTKEQLQLVGLSALMTTTVPAMERTIALLREKAPWVKVMVGGAVLTSDYAAKIGADFYGRDAMESVRIATRVFNREERT